MIFTQLQPKLSRPRRCPEIRRQETSFLTDHSGNKENLRLDVGHQLLSLYEI